MKGLGLKGLGYVQVPTSVGALGGLPFVGLDLSLLTFTPGMAKRATSVFSTSPIVQGKRDGSGGGSDTFKIPNATSILGSFYNTLDIYQGSVCFRITPEWNGNDGLIHPILFDHGSGSFITKLATNYLVIYLGASALQVDVSGWIAGTAYNICIRWDSKNTIDGTNYGCISINDVHTFGVTSTFTYLLWLTNPDISYVSSNSGNFIIEGLTIFRRVLFDGTYGVDVNGGIDEVNLISAGIDPTSLGGSWDVPFCLPTNQTAGAIVTGTGEAWSHPWTSNVVTDPWLSSYYGGGAWGVKFNGSSTRINCGSDASLDDIPAGGFMQVEFWIKFTTTTSTGVICKSNGSTTGWRFLFGGSGETYFRVHLATTNMEYTTTLTSYKDGKWHHTVLSYNDTSKKGRIAVDGNWFAESSAGSGAYVSDAASNLVMGADFYYFTGSLGWVRIHNHEHYTSGTNFVPPRTFPGADGGTVECWSLNDGTGATAAAVVNVANNGTITAGTWEPQWQPELTPVLPTSLSLTNASSRLTVGSGAVIDDLALAAMTIEGWIKLPPGIASTVMVSKGVYNSTGWHVYYTSGTLRSKVECATTDASVSTPNIEDNRWHHFAMTYDDTGDRKIRMYVDGVYKNVSSAAVGAVNSDAAQDGQFVGANVTGGANYGWQRWSNSKRYIDGANFTVPSRIAPPAPDANTMAQWNMDDGVGTTVVDDSGGGSTGTITNTYVWNNTPNMDTDAPGNRIYGWGQMIGSDAANDGIKQTLTGLTAGADYVVRALGFSGASGLGQPAIIIYDETNAATITSMTGTITSTYKVPDVFIFSFELPTNARGAAADCTSISIKLINAAGAGVVGWHQCEVLPNLIDNPSLDTGAVANPFIPYGWSNINLAVGESSSSAVTHSGGLAGFQMEAGIGLDHGMKENHTLAAGKYVCGGYWQKRAVGDVNGSYFYSGYFQNTIATYRIFDPNSLTWQHNSHVFRTLLNGDMCLRSNINVNQSQIHYFDDFYVIALNDVSLTVTPASQANSLEGTGVRVDGLDAVTQPVGILQPTSGQFGFRATFRHSAADFVKFGNATPYLACIYGNANNRIYVYESAANQISLAATLNGVAYAVAWDCTGLIVAGSTYRFDILYTNAFIMLMFNGVPVAFSLVGSGFVVGPTTIYLGQSNASVQQIDAVLSPPT